MNKKFSALLTLSLILTIGIYLMTSRIYHLNEIYQDKPKEIVAVNVTSSTAKIYWKANHEQAPKLLYKETTETGLPSEAYVNVYPDNLSGSEIYISEITDLEPNTEYTFEIETTMEKWSTETGETLSFTTSTLGETPSLPNIATGSSSPMDFVLIENNGKKYMLDTEYHGTWAMDLEKGEDYKETKYGNYMPESQLATYSSDILRIPKAYAQSGANCKTGATANYGVASKSVVAGVATRNISGCPNGHYANECYSRVVCTASQAGIDPAVVLSSWLLETTASSYDAFPNSPVFQDFGINITTSDMDRNFENQLDWYMKNQMKNGGDSYIRSGMANGCTYAAALAQAQQSNTGIDPNVILFSAKFSSGDICDIKNGERYAKSLTLFYNWITNEDMTYPFTKTTSLTGSCNFTGTNKTYNSCDGSTTGGGGDDDNTETEETPTTGTIACGQSGCTKDADCKGWESRDIECDETLSHKASDQYCTRIECPAGQLLAEDRCTCTDGEEYEIELQAGVNFIVIDKNPYIDGEKVRAKYLMNNNSEILSIGEYVGGEWTNILTRDGSEIVGENFRLDGDHAYLIITEEDLTVEYNGLGTVDQDLSKVKGWTLVSKDTIGESSAQSIITDYKDLTINHIAVWDYPTAMFENLAKDVDGSFYGENISLSDVDTLFIKIE